MENRLPKYRYQQTRDRYKRLFDVPEDRLTKEQKTWLKITEKAGISLEQGSQDERIINMLYSKHYSS